MSNGSQIGGVVGGIVGGVIGYFAGNPVQGAQWGYAIGSAVGGYVDPTRTYGPRLEDASAQTSTVGGPIPFGYGTFTVAGNIIWADQLVEHKKTERVGKGGSEKQTTYTYTRSYAIGVCEGPITNFVWIKKNGKLVYSANPAALGAAMGWTGSMVGDLSAASSEFRGMATLYYGTTDQMPDSTIEAVVGVGNVSPFRDLAYIVLENEDLTDMQGAVSQYEFCVFRGAARSYTTPPYPAYVVDSVGISTNAKSGILWSPPLDELGVSSYALDGSHRDLIAKYSYGPEEVDVSSYALDGFHRALLVRYDNYPIEEIETSSRALDGVHKVILIPYLNYEPEEVDVTSHALDGTHGPA